MDASTPIDATTPIDASALDAAREDAVVSDEGVE